MSEPESEDEILDRIEDALRRIASATTRPRAQPAPEVPAAPPLDREALATALDSLIAHLRGVLAQPQPPETE